MKHDSDILKRIKHYFMRRKSAEEARAFEAEAERDAFLYEAMEGLEGMMASELQQSMDELDDRLDAKSSTVALLPSLKLAAGLAAIMAIGVSVYFITQNLERGDLPAADSGVEEHEGSYEPREAVPGYDSLPAIVMKEDTAVPAVDSSIMDVAMAEPKEELERAIPDEAIAEEAVGETITYIAETADALETSGQEPQAMEEEIASADTEEDSALDAAPAYAVQEVQQAAVRKSESLKNAAAESIGYTQSATPVGGMAAFKRYVASNKKTSENMPSGAVVLSFETDRKGRPKNIEVVESLCTACDAEAIRLLENGPVWESESRKQRNTVYIEL